MVKLTKNQQLNLENIHFHLVDLKNTINDDTYTKEDYLTILDHLIDFVKRIMES